MSNIKTKHYPMKNRFLITLLITLQLSANATEKDSIIVTYIANCGFLIEMESTKIIIDGIFTNGFNRYETPDSSTLDLMLKGSAPFDDIDYVLITHKHADHFDSKTVSSFMINNIDSKLICPKQVDDELKKNNESYNLFSQRVIECTPQTFISKKINLDALAIIGYRTAHMNERNKHIENVAFLVKIGDKSIFHTGDADPNQIYRYSGKTPSEESIDIAFINGAFVNHKNFKLTNDFINADTNVAMHFPKNFFKVEHEMIKDVPAFFKEPTVFKELMEVQIFYITKQ